MLTKVIKCDRILQYNCNLLTFKTLGRVELWEQTVYNYFQQGHNHHIPTHTNKPAKIAVFYIATLQDQPFSYGIFFFYVDNFVNFHRKNFIHTIIN